MKIREEETQSFFGFIVPVRQAMWVELLVIQVIIFVIYATFVTKTIVIILKYVIAQVVVPNSSFLGHLAGILAGILYIKVPQSYSHFKIYIREAGFIGWTPLYQGLKLDPQSHHY